MKVCFSCGEKRERERERESRGVRTDGRLVSLLRELADFFGAKCFVGVTIITVKYKQAERRIHFNIRNINFLTSRLIYESPTKYADTLNLAFTAEGWLDGCMTGAKSRLFLIFYEGDLVRTRLSTKHLKNSKYIFLKKAQTSTGYNINTSKINKTRE